MAYKTTNNQTYVTTLRDENNMFNISFQSTRFDDADGECGIRMLVEVNGGIWHVSGKSIWSNPDADAVLRDMTSSYGMGFYDCINDSGRKRPRQTMQDRVFSLIRADIEKHSTQWENALRTTYNQAAAIAGAANDAAANEIEQLKEQLKAAQDATKAAQDAHAADVARCDVNALIMGSVVDALTPQICDRIRERVGSLIDCVPTRLEVKIRDNVIQTTEAVRHEKFEKILNIVAAGFPVWLMGDAGTGKSVLCEQIAEALDAEYYYSGAILDEFSGLKGFIDANGVKHGTQFTAALETAASGKDVVFCMDECDGSTPEVLLVLNNLLSGGAVECMGTCYVMNDHLHIIACGNTNGRGGNNAYTRSIIDSATLDRFMMVDVDYSPAIELVSAGNDEDLASFARTIRQTAKRCGIDMLITYRAIKRLNKLADVIGKSDALRGGMLRGLDASDIETLIYETRNTLNGNVWYDALKSCK